MDDPTLETRRHDQALEELTRLNAFSGSVRILWPPMQALACHATTPLRVLDVATGAGDVPLRLWSRARRAGVALQLEGCDRSPMAVAHAQARARRAGADLRFFVLDLLHEEIPRGYDVICCSLFLHHLGEEEAVRLLRAMAQAATRLVLVHDLVRSVPGWLWAYLGTRVLTCSDVVRTDGLLSVRAAYTVEEIRALARAAGLSQVSMTRHWPSRFLLVWRVAP